MISYLSLHYCYFPYAGRQTKGVPVNIGAVLWALVRVGQLGGVGAVLGEGLSALALCTDTA